MNDPRTTTDPLALGARVFRRWRAVRRSPTQHVPPALRTIARLLLDIEPLDTVGEALGIEPATLRRWRAVRDGIDDVEHDDVTVSPIGDSSPPTSSIAFVPLPAPVAASVASGPPDGTVTVSMIERTDGLRLHLTTPVALVNVAALLGDGGTAR